MNRFMFFQSVFFLAVLALLTGYFVIQSEVPRASLSFVVMGAAIGLMLMVMLWWLSRWYYEVQMEQQVEEKPKRKRTDVPPPPPPPDNPGWMGL